MSEQTCSHCAGSGESQNRLNDPGPCEVCGGSGSILTCVECDAELTGKDIRYFTNRCEACEQKALDIMRGVRNREGEMVQ